MEGRLAPVHRAEGIVDTGAEITCIDRSVADKLLLEPLELATMHTASGVQGSAVYYVELRLGWRQEHPPDPLTVRAYSVALKGAGVLVGLDVLRLGRLNLDGPNRRFELFLPRRREPS